jgi:hypothetical protein
MPADNDRRRFYMIIVVYKIVVGRDNADVGTNIGIVADLDTIGGIDINPGRVAGKNIFTFFYPCRVVYRAGMVYSPGNAGILAHYFPEKKISTVKPYTHFLSQPKHFPYQLRQAHN